MKKVLIGAGCIALLLLFFPATAARGQSVVANGDFELQDRGPWDLTGDNDGAKCLIYDVNGDGVKSWCWKRQPGTKTSGGGNGGLSQTINLVAGVTYDFSANICYSATC